MVCHGLFEVRLELKQVLVAEVTQDAVRHCQNFFKFIGNLKVFSGESLLCFSL